MRGRGVEVLDDQGRGRASITTYGKAEGGGRTYEDIVVFRLHDRAGKPMIKLDMHTNVNGLKVLASGCSELPTRRRRT